MVLGISFEQRIIYKLHIIQHFFFTSFTGAFTKATIVYQYHIIIVSIKITGVLGPTLYAATIPMKIQYESCWFFAKEMKSVYPDPRRHIKKILPERNIVFKLEILF